MWRGNSEPDTVKDWRVERGSHYLPPGLDHLHLDPTVPPNLSSYMLSPLLPYALHWQPDSTSPNTILNWFLPFHKPTGISDLWLGHLFSPENVIAPTSTSHSNSRPAHCPPTGSVFSCKDISGLCSNITSSQRILLNAPIILFLRTLTNEHALGLFFVWCFGPLP